MKNLYVPTPKIITDAKGITRNLFDAESEMHKFFIASPDIGRNHQTILLPNNMNGAEVCTASGIIVKNDPEFIISDRSKILIADNAFIETLKSELLR